MRLLLEIFRRFLNHGGRFRNMSMSNKCSSKRIHGKERGGFAAILGVAIALSLTFRNFSLRSGCAQRQSILA